MILRAICELYYKQELNKEYSVLLVDEDGHYGLLYQNPDDSDEIAFLFQKGFCPIVYPEPNYKVVLVSKHWSEIIKYIEPVESKNETP